MKFFANIFPFTSVICFLAARVKTSLGRVGAQRETAVALAMLIFLCVFLDADLLTLFGSCDQTTVSSCGQ